MWDAIQISVLPLKGANYHVRFAKGPSNYWLCTRFLSQTWADVMHAQVILLFFFLILMG